MVEKMVKFQLLVCTHVKICRIPKLWEYFNAGSVIIEAEESKKNI